jgi:hypothetical protein
MRENPVSSRFYPYVMNNYWHTNYKADQGGTFVFNYSIHPHGRFDPVEEVKWGRERRSAPYPLMGARLGVEDPVDPLLSITPQTVIVESVEPAGNGESLLLLLYNPSASPAAVSITGRGGDAIPFAQCDPSGIAAGAVVDELTLAPHASRYILTGRISK